MGERINVVLRCHIEYEEGEDFCTSCGGPLVTKEKPISGDEDKNKAEEKKTDTRLICPNCKILYERMKTCIRCGAPLGKQTICRKRGAEVIPDS